MMNSVIRTLTHTVPDERGQHSNDNALLKFHENVNDKKYEATY